jgi:hypothetical protein
MSLGVLYVQNINTLYYFRNNDEIIVSIRNKHLTSQINSE